MPSESPGTDLHALIHALQPMEKRYFKLYASRMGQDRAKKYLLLYDHLLQQPAWSEAAVRAAFAGEAFTRQLNVACLYLYDLLLASLRGYDQDRTAVSECGRRLDEVALLYERKLAPACAASSPPAASPSDSTSPSSTCNCSTMRSGSTARKEARRIGR